MHFKLFITFIASVNVYFLAMFNQSMIKGSTFTIGGLFGICEVIGVFLGDRIIEYVPDHLAYMGILAIGLTMTTILKLVSFGQTTIYILFLT